METWVLSRRAATYGSDARSGRTAASSSHAMEAPGSADERARSGCAGDPDLAMCEWFLGTQDCRPWRNSCSTNRETALDREVTRL
jgi:hypothetical protein